jgi:flagellar capping protein FliD
MRGIKVMLDRDLADLYGVETKRLKEQVRRNIKRFPEDFMFRLTFKEESLLRSQFATLEGKGKHSKYLSMAFTEQGVSMLSSVLKSDQAIQVNIEIMRTFSRLRQMLEGHKELQKKIEAMEAKYDRQFRVIFEAIKQMLKEDKKPKRKIGF